MNIIDKIDYFLNEDGQESVQKLENIMDTLEQKIAAAKDPQEKARLQKSLQDKKTRYAILLRNITAKMKQK